MLTIKNIPWKDILTSKNLWAINIVLVCNGFGRTVGQKMLPQFMEEILKLPISEVKTFVSSLFLANFFSAHNCLRMSQYYHY